MATFRLDRRIVTLQDFPLSPLASLSVSFGSWSVDFLLTGRSNYRPESANIRSDTDNAQRSLSAGYLSQLFAYLNFGPAQSFYFPIANIFVEHSMVATAGSRSLPY